MADNIKVIFDGEDILSLSGRQMRARRSDMQIIFQDPFSSLNPRNTVMQTIAEGVRMRSKYKTRAQVESRVLELMETVGLAERLINSYPHELDGGRRQRIGIARALAVEPKLIVCDEPVSALYVSIQAQILNLLKDLQKKLGLTYIFITHDLAVVNHISDEIMVMYLGQTVEKAPSEELFDNPTHPYTKALLSAIPIPKVGGSRRERILLRGEVSSPVDPGDVCRFASRCHRLQARKQPAMWERSKAIGLGRRLFSRSVNTSGLASRKKQRTDRERKTIPTGKDPPAGKLLPAGPCGVFSS